MVILSEIVPPSSSSYDVFLSFRGKDTRNGFTDHLYNALLDAGIITFLDDEEIETGEPLKPELENAIRSSRASIIIMSENYASSTWCLDELVLILHQNKICNQIVIPIFYHVEPTHVRKQQNSFGEAMAEHKQKMEAETDAEKRSQFAQKMESWKMALREVADLKGEDVKDRKESMFINDVVADIHRRLRVPLSNTLPRLIGVDHEIEYISSWLTDGSSRTADILTIVGLSGIGKTFLARHVYRLHSGNFDKSSFIEGINATANERSNGLLDLQKQLHGDVSKKIELRVNDVIGYTSKIAYVLARKRVFIVLDDIGSLKQLDALLGNKGLHPGSKIIVTTKEASLTERCALFKSQVHRSHKEVFLNVLNIYDSLRLLCIHAFDSQNPKEGYEEVSKELAKYCEGLPLAIEILGSSLQNQDVADWEDCINVLKKEPHSRINTALKMGFDALVFQFDKELFKHIACFFVGTNTDLTETILNACDLKARIGITHLIDRCLLRIDSENNLIMHQLVQEMGRDLVRQESPMKPWKRSRLWCHEESFKVLKQKKAKGNTLGLAFDMKMLDKKRLHGSFELKTELFSAMNNLMLLQLNYVQLNGCFDNFPEELRWLCMRGSPLKSIPLDLPMEKIVVLDMSYSNIEYFDMLYGNPQPPTKRQKGLIGTSSNDKRLLGSLKILDLSNCKQLHSVGGFSELPALERLILQNCTGLIEVCESIEHCHDLVDIELSYCYKLRKLPKSLCKLKKHRKLLLDGCNSLESQTEIGNMKAIPRDFKLTMIPLSSALRILSIAYNNLSNECFPKDWSCLAMLDDLRLDGNPIVSMPSCVRTLPRLVTLSMNNCDKLISIEHPPCTVTELSIQNIGEDNPSIWKIKFDPEMSALNLSVGVDGLFSSFEIDGMVNIQGMTRVEEKVLHSLGWKDLEFTKEIVKKTFKFVGRPRLIEWKRCEAHILCEPEWCYIVGVFSMLYREREMPKWITRRSKGPSITFTIPSSPKKLGGLNFFCIIEIKLVASPYSCLGGFAYPVIKISNITKNQTWLYDHYLCGHFEAVNVECLCDLSCRTECWLSHWMFGPNEMKAGDHITITLSDKHSGELMTLECGVGLVYDDGSIEEEEEEKKDDVLGYSSHEITSSVQKTSYVTINYVGL
ncbi:hypothetical protein R6Q59_023964 [Mikania micrantha]